MRENYCIQDSLCEEQSKYKRVVRLEEASNEVPQPLTVEGSAGKSFNYARADHEHPAIAPTPPTGDSSTKVATTEFVSNMLNELDDIDRSESGKFTTDVVQTDGKVLISNKAYVTKTIAANSSIITPNSDLVNVVLNTSINFTTDPSTNVVFDAVEVPTKKYVDEKISRVYIYLGTSTFNNLPTNLNNTTDVGKVYNVNEAVVVGTKTYPAGTNWAWNGNSWDPLGGEVTINVPQSIPELNPSGVTIGSVNGIEFKAKIPDYSNLNAFSNLKVGSDTIGADSETDTLELIAGNNITLTPDTTNDKITITAASISKGNNIGVGNAVSDITIEGNNIILHKTNFLTEVPDPDTFEFENLLKALDVPIFLNKNKHFYVDGFDKYATAIDNTDEGRGESMEKPWKTLLYAINNITKWYNINSQKVYIHIAGGIYNLSQPLVFGDFLKTTGSIYIEPYYYSDTIKNPDLLPYNKRLDENYDDVIFTRTSRSPQLLTFSRGSYHFFGFKFESFTTQLAVYLEWGGLDDNNNEIWITKTTGWNFPHQIDVYDSARVDFNGCDFSYESRAIQDISYDPEHPEIIPVKYDKEYSFCFTVSGYSTLTFFSNCRFFFNKGTSSIVCFRAADYGEISFSGISLLSTLYYKREYYIEGSYSLLFLGERHGSYRFSSSVNIFEPFLSYRKNLCSGQKYLFNEGSSITIAIKSKNLEITTEPISDNEVPEGYKLTDSTIHIYDENNKLVTDITLQNIFPGTTEGTLASEEFCFIRYVSGK